MATPITVPHCNINNCAPHKEQEQKRNKRNLNPAAGARMMTNAPFSMASSREA
ncbi:hypothetical protein ACO2RV_09955 [Ancylobacter sp. VNQ12]|uniref:hypothetical protein n=1 Tax=Ancylobacter sp. VNQ12 TaxID=3400920 RepID=UPI003C099AD1